MTLWVGTGPAGAAPAHIGLYVHVPFCVAKCDYCSFHSAVPMGPAEITSCVDATLSQAEALLAEFGWPVVRTIYVGGGTPSLLAPAELRRLGAGLLELTGGVAPAEWTVEVNPGSVTAEWVSALGDLPVTRVSLGVQSFSAAARRRIGRRGGIAPGPGGGDAAPEEALRLLGMGHGWSVGVDLIAGIPCADREAQLADIGRAVAAGVDHVSLYTLTVEEGTPLARRESDGRFALPDDEDVVRQVDAAGAQLAAAGLRRYEVSNYARVGRECRHNETYWLLDAYLGVGPSAVSTIPAAEGRALRIETTADFSMTHELVDRRSFLLEHFMMGLRRSAGLPPERVEERFGRRPAEFIPRTVERWVGAGLLQAEEGTIRLEPEGMWLLDRLLAEIAGELGAG